MLIFPANFSIIVGMKDTLVVDMETKKSFAEVGGEKNIRDLGISVAGVYSYNKDAFFAFEEHELPKVEEMLHKTSHLIGFNIKHFDIPVLEPYMVNVDFSRIAVTDIFEDMTNFLGHRVGLGGVAKATLNASKSGNGLEALQWFRDGRVEEVKSYCLDDVRLTRDLYEYGKTHGHVLFDSYLENKVKSVPVIWGAMPAKPILEVLLEALQLRRRLAIEYVSAENDENLGFKKSRLIDVYKIKGREIEAYCHLRSAVRIFRLNRILSAKLTAESYLMPQDLQQALF